MRRSSVPPPARRQVLALGTRINHRGTLPLARRDFPPELPGAAWLTVAEVLLFVPVSRSAWFRAVKLGQVPAPHKLGRLAFWTARDIRNLLNVGPRRARRPRIQQHAETKTPGPGETDAGHA